MKSTGNVLAWTHVTEVELVYKSKVKPSERPTVRCPEEIYKLLLALWNPDVIELREEFKVLLLNRGNKVLGIYLVSVGGLSATLADTRLILAAALKAGASHIVLTHNHPSGNLTPSEADLTLTAKVKMAAQFMDIKVIDHIIVGKEGYLSFANEGLL